MINISLILALRDQHEIFSNLMRSLRESTSLPKQVEILIVVDTDDFRTIDFINEYLTAENDFNVRLLTKKRSEWFIRDYYNFAEKHARGRWIMNINADSFFKTGSWDTIIDIKMSEAANYFGDDILYGVVRDGLKERDLNVFFSCWSLSSREYVKLMGGIMDGRIAAWGSDIALAKVFNFVDDGMRKVPIPEVFIDHISHHVYKDIPPSDHIKRFHQIVARYPSKLTDEQIQESAKKINDYINEKSLL